MMKRLILCALVLSFVLLVACNDTNDEDAEIDEINQIAEDFISLLAEGQYEEATQFFDATMKVEMPPEALREFWETLNEQVGGFIDQEYSTTTELNTFQVVMIKGLFEGTEVMFNITFNDVQRIAGFYVQ